MSEKETFLDIEPDKGEVILKNLNKYVRYIRKFGSIDLYEFFPLEKYCDQAADDDWHDLSHEETWEWLIKNAVVIKHDKVAKYLAEERLYSVIDFLLREYPNHIASNIFHSAIYEGDVKLVRLLIKYNHTSVRCGQITTAAANNYYDIEDVLLESGVKPNAETLNMALCNNAYESAKLLLEYGCPYNKNSFNYAIDSQNIKMVKLAIEHRLPVSEDDQYYAHSFAMQKLIKEYRTGE